MLEDEHEPLKRENRKLMGEATRLSKENEQLSKENSQHKMGTKEERFAHAVYQAKIKKVQEEL